MNIRRATPQARYALLLALLLAVPRVVLAQSAQFRMLASFGGLALNPSAPLLQASDGKLYGTATSADGNGPGAVFRVDASGVVETFYIFTPPLQPSAGLLQAPDGLFYGTAAAGASGQGNIFKVNSTGAVTVLHNFTGVDGGYPSGGLIQASDGALYGTTRRGGQFSYGTVFKIDSSGNFTLFHSFASTDGANPYAGLIQAPDGNFYGTTRTGGVGGSGTVFKMDAAGNVTVLHSFALSDGANPSAGLILAADGSFYGTTESGGAAGLGTVFKIDTSGNLTTLHSFEGFDGQSPVTPLLLASDGNYYGTTSEGGKHGAGTIFNIDPAGNFTKIHDFAWVDGVSPVAALIEDSDGRLYGTAQGGGHAVGGTLFSLGFAGDVEVLYRFKESINARSPLAGLLQASDGFLYGTTTYGGATDNGTIYRMDRLGNSVILHSFTGDDGAHPAARLIQGTDGNYYGTARDGGNTFCPGGCGTVFRMDSRGSVIDLYRFSGVQYHEGSKPYAGLLQASDGDFYGTTEGGGDNDYGTVFRIDPSGDFATLHHFNFDDGDYPLGDLIQGGGGFFYGTTFFGGILLCQDGCGTVFRMDPAGNLMTIHDFQFGAAGGVNPHAGLVRTSDSIYYGTTQAGSTLFQIGASGTFSVVLTFPAGVQPEATLVQATDGNLYGTTISTYTGPGGIFMTNPTPAFAMEYDFTGPDGAHPNGALIQGLDGWLYGTTFQGGSNGQGVVFAILPPGVFAVSDLTVACGGDGGGTVTTISGSFPDSNLSVTVGGNAATILSEADAQLEIETPPGPPGALSDVVVNDIAIGAHARLLRAFLYDFLDVPASSPFHDFVCKVVHNGLSAGCGGGNLCAAAPVLRSQMAVFLLQGEHGSVYIPPASDCGTYPFSDVTCPSVFADFILQASLEGVMGSCSTSPPLFCPNDPVSRADAAVFLLKAVHGTGYVPPACVGIFADVACPGPFTDWIEDLYNEGITGGCNTNPLMYCPGNSVTRAQMSVFLTVTFNLP